MRLPKDTTRVFANPNEFITHHEQDISPILTPGKELPDGD